MPLWEGGGDLGAIVFPSQLVPENYNFFSLLPIVSKILISFSPGNFHCGYQLLISLLGEREELSAGHEVVASVLAQVVRVLVVVL